MSIPAGRDPGRYLVLRAEALNLVRRCRHSGNSEMGRLMSLGSALEFLLGYHRLSFLSATYSRMTRAGKVLLVMEER